MNMSLLYRGISVAALLLLTACAGSPVYLASPVPAKKLSYAIEADPALEKNFEHVKRYLDADKSVIYFNSFGGGGAGLGVLLGPIGVAANIGMINKVTTEDAALLQGKLPVKGQQIVAALAKKAELPLGAAAGTDAARLTPFLFVTKTEDKQLLLSAHIYVNFNTTGQKWVGEYGSQLPLKLSFDEVAKGLDAAKLAQLEQLAAAEFERAFRLFEEDRAGKFKAQKEVRITSELFTPRMSFEFLAQELQSDDARLTVRTTASVFSFPKNMVKIAAR